MSLNIKINDVPVNVIRRPSGYFFRVSSVMKAADAPKGTSMKAISIYRRSGHALQRFPSDPWFMDAGGFRDCAGRTRAEIRAGRVPEGQQEEFAAFADRLEACVAACEDWADSRKIPAWRSVSPVEGSTDWGVVVNDSLIRAARNGQGRWFFQPSGILRAAGIPADRSAGLVEAYRPLGHAVKGFLPGTSMSVWFVDLDGYRNYAAWQRKEARSAVDSADRQYGVGWVLYELDETEEAMARLEECVAQCESWIAYRGALAAADGCSVQTSVPEDGTTDGVDPDGLFDDDSVDLVPEDPFVDCQEDAAEEEFNAEDPFADLDKDDPGPVVEPDDPAPPAEEASETVSDGRPGRNPIVPKGHGAGLMAEALLDRLPLLCKTFGIDPGLGRDEQMAWIVWLLVFRDEAVDGPGEGADDTAFLWRGKRWQCVKELVGAAMTE